MRRSRGVLLAAGLVMIVGACVPSDPKPPADVFRTGNGYDVRLDAGEEARIVGLEVVVNPSQVIRADDRRGWVIRGTKATAVARVSLGEVPSGWEEQVAWSDPRPSASAVVIRLTDGREGVLAFPE